jgi:pilus assembly protein CpaF
MVCVARVEKVGKETQVLELESDTRMLFGNSSLCLVQLSGCPAGVLLGSLKSENGSLGFRVLAGGLSVISSGRTLEVGEFVPIASSLEIYFGKTLYKITRYFDLQSSSAENVLQSLAQAGLAKGSLMELQVKLTKALQASLNLSELAPKELNTPETRSKVESQLKSLVYDEKRSGLSATEVQLIEIEKAIVNEVVGLGPLEDLLSDPKVTEIMVNSPSQIFVERGGHLTLSELQFSSDLALLSTIERIASTVNRRVDTSSPIVDARLLDGSRVNAVIPPIALKGACLTIRRFSKKPISMDKLVEWKSVSAFASDFLRAAVEARLNIVISGGTGSGKTTLLNALSGFIPFEERIVTVEDAAELQLQQPHVVSLEARPANMEGKGAITIRDLVKNCLRMRPDRIVVGECRGGEALDMLQAMNTGHDGSLTTAHANNPSDMLRRLETMVMMAGVDFPLRAIREQVSSAIQMIVQQTRFHTGRRRVTALTAIDEMTVETSSYNSTPLVWFEAHEGSDEGDLRFDIDAIKKFAKKYAFSKKCAELLEIHKEEVGI